jgi:hypothetical protein
MLTSPARVNAVSPSVVLEINFRPGIDNNCCTASIPSVLSGHHQCGVVPSPLGQVHIDAVLQQVIDHFLVVISSGIRPARNIFLGSPHSGGSASLAPAAPSNITVLSLSLRRGPKNRRSLATIGINFYLLGDQCRHDGVVAVHGRRTSAASGRRCC